MARIQFNIPDEIYYRIKKHPRFPKSQAGGAISKFWAELFLKGSVQSTQFINQELRAELRLKDTELSDMEFLHRLSRQRASQTLSATGSQGMNADLQA